jgi:mannose-6-phosphate isomerase
MPAAYFLQTEPAFRDYLWGGRKLETVLGKQLPAEGVWAESWEIVDHAEHQSVVRNGEFAGQSLREISQAHPKWLFGNSRIKHLPLLLKYLDCQRVLSVQVHPADDYALRMNPPDLGKTEAWYIVDAEPGAVLYAGLKNGVTRERLREAISSGSVEECLHRIEPARGDCVFIPAGTVHALGGGLLVAEIQQASNTTFRLFDWNRVDGNGKPRALHVEQSLEVIDFGSGPRPLQTPTATEQNGRERLVSCEKFIFDRLTRANGVAGDGRLHLLTAPYGGVSLACGTQTLRLAMGQSAIVPAAMAQVHAIVEENCILLDMYVP